MVKLHFKDRFGLKDIFHRNTCILLPCSTVPWKSFLKLFSLSSRARMVCKLVGQENDSAYILAVQTLKARFKETEGILYIVMIFTIRHIYTYIWRIVKSFSVLRAWISTILLGLSHFQEKIIRSILKICLLKYIHLISFCQSVLEVPYYLHKALVKILEP